MKKRILVTLVVSLALAVAACGGGGSAPKGGGSPTSTAAARPRSTGSIKILQPQAGQMIQGTKMLVKVEVTGAQVLTSGQASRDVRPDTGHVHLAVDGTTVTLLAGLEYEITDLTPGAHILQAEFAAVDHGFFNPRVIATATFTVQ